MFKTLAAGLATVALFAAVILLSDSQVGAAVITGVSIEEVSSEQNEHPFVHEAVRTIDGSGGVPTDSLVGDHGAAAGNMWLNRSSDGVNGCCPAGLGDPHLEDILDARLAHIVFDLGDVYDVLSVRVWNFNQNAGGEILTQRGVNDVTITYSETDPLTGLDGNLNGTDLGSFNFAEGTGAPIAGELFDITPGGIDFTARYVRFDVFSNHFPSELGFDGTFTGLSEVRFESSVPPPTDFTWNVDEGGKWSNPVNWTPGGSPNGGDVSVIFDSAITTSSTVFTDDEVTVNSIRFDNPVTYAVAGTGKVSLADDGGVAPTITVADGVHQFQVEVALLHDTTADIAAVDDQLVFNNTLDLGGRKLTKIGDGDMAIHGDLVSGGGTVDIVQGTVSGNGTVVGDVSNNGGTLSPGNSLDILAINGDYAQGTALVPEPTSLVLVLFSLLGMAAAGQRRRCRSLHRC